MSREAELEAALKRVHFELQEFFRSANAQWGGGYGNIERASTIAAEVLNASSVNVNLSQDELQQVAGGIITEGLRAKARRWVETQRRSPS